MFSSLLPHFQLHAAFLGDRNTVYFLAMIMITVVREIELKLAVSLCSQNPSVLNVQVVYNDDEHDDDDDDDNSNNNNNQPC